MEMPSIIALSFAAAFGATWISTRLALPFLAGRGVMGIDLHKAGEVRVVEMGGVGLVAGLMVAAGAVIRPASLGEPWIVVLIVMAMAAVGLCDDLKEIRGRVKFLLTLVLCVSVFYLLRTEASALVSRLLPSILLPAALGLAVAVSANAVNILAGFNGLESGTTAIAAMGLVAISLLGSIPDGAFASAALLGGCLAFLYYNRYPARAFPGDVGTLTMGGLLGLSAILARAEVVLPIILAPHLVELLCKVRNRFAPKSQTGHSRLGPDGKLVPGPYSAFVHLMMKRFPSSEKQLVFRIWLLEAMLSAGSVLVYLLLLLPSEL